MRRRGIVRPVVVAPRRPLMSSVVPLAAGVGVGMLASSASRSHAAPPPPPPPQYYQQPPPPPPTQTTHVVHTYQQAPPTLQPTTNQNLVFDPNTGQYYQPVNPNGVPVQYTTTTYQQQ